MKVKVPLFNTAPARAVALETEATKGAQFGVNLLDESGEIVSTASLLAGLAGQSTAPSGDLTTDDIAEADNLYFTDERAQDAVGGILAASADIALAYDDAAPAITPTLKTTGIAAGTYGDATHVARVTFDANGRATAVASVAISASGGGSGGVPYLIADGAVFTVPANQQLPWMVPGELDGSGSLDIEGALVEVA